MMTDEPEKKLDFSTLSLPIEKGDWCDADERMFQACFTILGQFVEKELGTESWEFEDKKSEMYRGYRLHSVGDTEPQAIDLWLWYKDELPIIEQEYADDLRETYSGKFITEELDNGMHRVVDFGKIKEQKFPHDYPEIIKDQKLKELIDLRRNLWT